MTGKTRTKLRDRWALRVFRRLSVLQRVSFLAFLGLVVALLLIAVRSVWMFAALMDARRRGPEEVCRGLIDMAQPDEITIVSDGWSGYQCEGTSADGGYAMQTGDVDTSLLLLFSLLLVAACVITLIGVLIAVIVRALLRLFGSTTVHRAGKWGTGLITSACLPIPWTYLFLYMQWYPASNSGGVSLDPPLAKGDEVASFGVEKSFIPPYIVWSGHSVNGAEFSINDYGIPFGLFIIVIVLFVAGLGLIITSRFLLKRASTSGQMNDRRTDLTSA